MRRGATSTLAMIYLALFSSLAAAMFAFSSLNVRTASNYADADRARTVAESGLRWIDHRFRHMPLPVTPAGEITPAVAQDLWPRLQEFIARDLAENLDPAERDCTLGHDSLATSPIAIDDDDARFTLRISPSPSDPRILRVASTGSFGNAYRTVSIDVRLDKRFPHAIASAGPLRLARNVLVDGDVAAPSLQTASDFRHLSPRLRTRIDALQSLVRSYQTGRDNRLDARRRPQLDAAIRSGFADVTGDGFIDEFDVLLAELDTNSDRALSPAEFTHPFTERPLDRHLFEILDGFTTGRDNVLNARDNYAKIRGHVTLPDAGVDLPITPLYPRDATRPPLRFAEVPIPEPEAFDTTSYKLRTGEDAGKPDRDGLIFTNVLLSPADANGGAVDEHTPYGSTDYDATYRRPVFRYATFVNVRIPPGLNALFDACTFHGVTFVELETDIRCADGIAYSKRMKSARFTRRTILSGHNSLAYSYGNNLRFNDCSIFGPLAADVPTADTAFANAWQFTGTTTFYNAAADPTAAIVAPRTHVELNLMADHPMTLTGGLIAGSLTLRGQAHLDGFLLTTSARPTTIGHLPDHPFPDATWGRITLRQNPSRPLPTGMLIPVTLTALPQTYQERR